MPVQKRISALKNLASEAGLDAVLINSIHDIFYYTGKTIRKEDVAFLLVPVRGKPRLFPSALSNEIKGDEHLLVKPITGKSGVVRRELARFRKIGFDERNMSVYLYNRLRTGSWKPFSAGIKKTRQVKDRGELNLMGKAIKVTLKCFRLRIRGRTEIELASEIERLIRKSGAEPSFPPIVSSGSNSGFIHHIPERSRIGRGLVIMDCGARLGGYCSDLTRTFLLSETPVQRRIFQDVEEMQGELIDTVRPGIRFRDVQERYEQLMKSGGYKVFHLFGHGVGLSVHEGPGPGDVLEPGMVLTVEPGVYEEKRGGCRIEDMVVVTMKGCRPLSRN
jgi:Xaa-Pro aminopeptidase